MTKYTDNEILHEIMIVLGEISITLKQMKEQERQYWETWKQAKEKENNVVRYRMTGERRDL